MSILRSFVDANVKWSQAFDRMLPSWCSIDGNRDFVDAFVPSFLSHGQSIVDIGGGKNPYLTPAGKSDLMARVTGIDISENELALAPIGAYDEVICADITCFAGNHNADLCICQAVLEHVPDTFAALRAIASTLKRGGIALVFVPSRNALFARLNLILPEIAKRFVLYNIFPQSRRNQGFRSYYDRCTPGEFEAMAHAVGLSVVSARFYYTSGYFSFLVPLHVCWRAWVFLFKAIARDQAAETFSYALRKEQ